MEFIPEMPKETQEVPYFDDVDASQGWQGQSTGKSINKLKSEIAEAITRLGGIISGFQQGTFIIHGVKREGFQLHYVIEQESGTMFRGRMDIAALPVKDKRSLRRSYQTRKEKSLKMSLFMLRNALSGTWFLQQLSPGYAPLMPWMLEERTGKTITQMWSEHESMRQLLPPSNGDFVEGEFEEVE